MFQKYVANRVDNVLDPLTFAMDVRFQEKLRTWRGQVRNTQPEARRSLAGPDGDTVALRQNPKRQHCINESVVPATQEILAWFQFSPGWHLGVLIRRVPVCFIGERLNLQLYRVNNIQGKPSPLVKPDLARLQEYSDIGSISMAILIKSVIGSDTDAVHAYSIIVESRL